MNSRQKGARGEREAAAAWAAAVGGTARRGQQFHGGTDSPDVVTSIPGIHLEVKRVERGNPYSWVDQAVRDAGDSVPVVLHKRNFCDWLVVLRLSDVTRLAAQIGAQAQALGGAAVPGDFSSEGVPAGTQPDGGSHGVHGVERREGASGHCSGRCSGCGESDSDVCGGMGARPNGTPNRRTGGRR